MAHFLAVPNKESVDLIVNGRLLTTFGWKAARACCDALLKQLRSGSGGETSVSQGGFKVAFRREPKLRDESHDKIVCIANGQMLFDAPLPVAKQIWEYLSGQQRLAEEWANAASIAADAAILARTGAPVGITSHPKIQEEAKKIAQGDSDLRRYIPVPSPRAGVRGAPRVFNDDRTPKERFLADLSKLPADERKRAIASLH